MAMMDILWDAGFQHVEDRLADARIHHLHRSTSCLQQPQYQPMLATCPDSAAGIAVQPCLVMHSLQWRK